jgi:hypothetical protein
MSFDLLKTRKGKLVRDLKNELANDNPSLDRVLEIIQEYEKNNLNTIEKLKRDKVFETKRISGALKQTIHAHGPITSNLIGSATKRIYGSLLKDGEPRKKLSTSRILLIIYFILLLLLI